jgi:serine/threonine protein kinase
MPKNRSTGSPKRIRCFNFKPGTILAGKYDVVALLGLGYEGEVYLVRERGTGIERAAKVWYPQRNPGNRAAVRYARKLHKLRHCHILIQYHTHEKFAFASQEVHVLVSEFVEGELLSDFLARQPGRRISVFQGLHLLYALAEGIESIHNLQEYHGDLHEENVVVRRYGLSFDLKLVDMYHWGAARAVNIHDDVCDMVRLFYDAVGGRKHYRNLPEPAKAICRGLKRSLILKQFRNAGQLRQYLETLRWD